MTYKKIFFTSVVFIFLISTIIHNIYTWFPSTLTFMLFPINESIWEHQKMIFMAYLIWGIVAYFILKKNNLSTKNLIFSIVASAIFNITIFLIVYTPIYITFGHNLIVTLIIYFITIVLSNYLGYIILDSNKYYQKLNIISIALIPIIIAVFAFLSYRPLHYKPLFFDESSGIYGAKKNK